MSLKCHLMSSIFRLAINELSRCAQFGLFCRKCSFSAVIAMMRIETQICLSAADLLLIYEYIWVNLRQHKLNFVFSHFTCATLHIVEWRNCHKFFVFIYFFGKGAAAHLPVTCVNRNSLVLWLCVTIWLSNFAAAAGN